VITAGLGLETARATGRRRFPTAADYRVECLARCAGRRRRTARPAVADRNLSMSYSRDQVKQITDKVLNMCKADAVEVRFSGGERSATRFANSSITANLIEHDQEVSVTVFYGQKTASATTHQFDDASLKRMIEQVQELARRKPDNPELMPPVKPPQNYVEIDAVLPATENFGPAERAANSRVE
jgi:hypothetical protein